MKCEDVLTRLSLFVDGELTGNERDEVEGHLSRCPECSAAFREFTAAVEHLRAMPEEIPPPWLRDRIMTSIRAEAGTKKNLWQRLLHPLHIKVPLEAMAAAAMVLLALQLYSTDTTLQRQAQPPALTERVEQAMKQEPPVSRREVRQPPAESRKAEPPAAPEAPPTAQRSDESQRPKDEGDAPQKPLQDMKYEQLAAKAAPPPVAGRSADNAVGRTEPAAPARARAPGPAKESLQQAEKKAAPAFGDSHGDGRYREIADIIRKQASRQKAKAEAEQELRAVARQELTGADIPVLIRMLSDKDTLLANEAERLLVSFGPQALPYLIKASESADAVTAERAARAIRSIRAKTPQPGR